MLPVTPLSRNEVLDSSHQGASGLTPDTSSVNVSRHSTVTKPVQFEDGATCKECNIELWTEAKAIGTKKRKRHFDMHGLVAV